MWSESCEMFDSPQGQDTCQQYIVGIDMHELIHQAVQLHNRKKTRQRISDIFYTIISICAAAVFTGTFVWGVADLIIRFFK